MQTFLPLPDYVQSAQMLDNKRLGKQRVECLQILKALHDPSYGWQSHPAVKMWEGHVQSLVEYSLKVCLEWRARGFNDTCLDKIAEFIDPNTYWPPNPKPPWLNEEFCRSHQSKLKSKLPEHYDKLFPAVPNDLPYVWPNQK
jgi:hypothetical protein